jgi:MFS family permease
MLSRSLILLTIGEFAINAGRGALTLVLGAILYEQTGGVWAFALAFLSDFLVAIFIQGIAGSMVDKHGPGKILNITLTLSCCILAVCWVAMLNLEETATLIFSCAVLLSVFRPFIRTSVFSLLPALFSESALQKANGTTSLAFQLGQFAGMLIAGATLELGSNELAIFVILMTFSVSAISYFSLSLTHLNTKPTSNVTSKYIGWKSIRALVRQGAVLRGCVIGSIDYALIAVFNLLLAPVVAHNFDNLSRWLGILDAAFAVGAIAAGVFVIKKNQCMGLKYRYSLLAHTSAALLLVGYALQWSSYVILIFVISFGLFSTVSVVMWNTLLQKNAPEEIRGRVASAKYILNTLAVSIAITCVSFANDFSFKVACYSAVLITVISFIVTFGFFVRGNKRSAPIRLGNK